MDTGSSLVLIRGVGEKTAKAFEKRGVFTAGDLLHFYPRSYAFYEPVIKVEDIRFNDGASEADNVSLQLTIRGNARKVRLRNRAVTHFTAGDETGTLRITFFNMPYIVHSLSDGVTKVFRGTVKRTADGGLFMVHPQIFKPEEYSTISGSLLPHYAPVSGVSDDKIRKMVRYCLSNVLLPDEYMTEEELSRYSMKALPDAVSSIHFPAGREDYIQARNRLVFDEFLLFLLSVKAEKKNTAGLVNLRPMIRTADTVRFIEALPYKLTPSQQEAFSAIEDDLCSDTVMNRLLQGDVGSGKTIVAFLSLTLCASNNRQGALMAPTEILAVQHMNKLSALASKYSLPVRPVLLTGSVKGKERTRALSDISDGTANVIIGTHALIQEKVDYKDLGLVITDEQHRFGVRQREALSGKGMNVPIMVMSATPIPRTLAMIMYGDLQTSILREKPGGRLPVRNLAMADTGRGKALRFLLDQIDQGRQAYIICPAVEKNEASDLNNVETYSEELRNSVPPKYRIGVLHGRMKTAQKNKVMQEFSEHLTDILVSTTVVEVGVDVANATVMLIENAERFGLSQLHQLRGRVGRSDLQSYCIFLYHSENGRKPERLSVLEKTNDGFEIAEKDLEMRGPGDLFGTLQSGEAGFVLGDIYTDQQIMYRANEYADAVIAGHTSDNAPASWSAGSVDFRTI
ncbi:MAG: ATP-dependent DNA helicase RecG [Lachnospiraceae bacterium]|nr:ATP-dependent DNA helicase RecG [Lachnospiraceae bacterium]